MLLIRIYAQKAGFAKPARGLIRGKLECQFTRDCRLTAVGMRGKVAHVADLYTRDKGRKDKQVKLMFENWLASLQSVKMGFGFSLLATELSGISCQALNGINS